VGTSRNRRLPAFVAVVAVGLGGALSCGDDDGDDGSTGGTGGSNGTAAQYAEDVCGAALEWQQEVAEIRDDLDPSLVEANADPLVYVQQIVGDAVTVTRQFADALESATPPDTPSGEQLAQAVDDTIVAVTAALENSVGALADAQGTADLLATVSAIAADVSAAAGDASAALSDLQASDPEDELGQAFESTASCDELQAAAP
jgi:hypothetical protein